METAKTIRSIVKIAALAIIVIFFIPTFCVSCGSYAEVEFSAFDAAIDRIDNKAYDEMETEMTDDDEAEIKAAPILFIIVVFAVVIFKYNNTRPLTSMLCAAGCAVAMLVMKQRVAKFIGGMEYAMLGIEMRTTAAYAIHMVVSIGIIVVLLFERYFLTNPGRQENMKETAGKIWEGIKNMDKPAGNANGQENGMANPKDNEDAVVEEKKTQKEIDFWVCSCGAKNSATRTFCSVCYKNRPNP